jgi:hypothetical protein
MTFNKDVNIVKLINLIVLILLLNDTFTNLAKKIIT